MKTYESKQKQILRPQADIYARLSNLTNLEQYIQGMPSEQRELMSDKIKDLRFEEDSISFSVPPIGDVTLRIIAREEPKMLKFGADNLPIDLNFWIQLVGVSECDTRMKLTLKADIPLMLRPMIGSKLDDGIERVADMIAVLLNR